MRKMENANFSFLFSFTRIEMLKIPICCIDEYDDSESFYLESVIWKYFEKSDYR